MLIKIRSVKMDSNLSVYLKMKFLANVLFLIELKNIYFSCWNGNLNKLEKIYLDYNYGHEFSHIEYFGGNC